MLAFIESSPTATTRRRAWTMAPAKADAALRRRHRRLSRAVAGRRAGLFASLGWFWTLHETAAVASSCVMRDRRSGLKLGPRR